MDDVREQNKRSWDAMADSWFGTTALPAYGCYIPTEERLKLFPDLRGKRVLDVGCGSGILSVAALLLGAEKAVGVDIDPLAVKTADENAARNHVEDRFTGICGDLTDRVSGTYDVVVANIVADVICVLTADVRRFMKPDTVYVMSGIIDTREADVLVALEKAGFELIERREEKGWVALSAKMA